MTTTATRLGALATTPVAGASPTGRRVAGYGRLDELVFDKLFNSLDPNPDAVDWPAALEESLRLLEESRDLRFARWVAHALIEMEGVAGLEQGIELLSGLIATFDARLLPEDADKKRKAIEDFDTHASAALERRADANGKGPDIAALLAKSKALGDRMSSAEAGRLPRLSQIEQWLAKRSRSGASSAGAESADATSPATMRPAAGARRAASARHAAAATARTPASTTASGTGVLHRARFHELGTTPISAAGPAGPRLTDWGILATEYYQKLSSPMASGEIDWRTVASGGLELLARSKDLRLAIVTTTALMRTEPLAGLRDGIELMALLGRTFGEQLHPADPAERASKLEAFDLEATEWLNEARPRARPEALPLLDSLVVAAQEAHSSLAPLANGNPIFPRLKRMAIELKGALEREADEAQRRATPSAPATAIPAGASHAVGGGVRDLDGGAGTGVADGVRASAGSSISSPTAIESPAQANQVLADVNKLLRLVARHYRTEKPLEPLGRRLERLGLWSRVVMRPKDGAIDGPPKAVVERLTAAVAAGESPVEELERVCSTSIFWLTGQRLLHDCALAAGDAAGAASIRAECAALVAALPGLGSMIFKDGEPAADAATVAWLSSSGTPAVALVTMDATAEDAAALIEVRKQAQGLLRKQQLAAAVALYEARWKTVHSVRNAFRWKFDLAQLLARQHTGLARSLLLELERLIDAHDLMRWEPALACEVYMAELKLCPKEDGPRREMLCAKMFQVDAKRAASL